MERFIGPAASARKAASSRSPHLWPRMRATCVVLSYLGGCAVEVRELLHTPIMCLLALAHDWCHKSPRRCLLPKLRVSQVRCCGIDKLPGRPVRAPFCLHRRPCSSALCTDIQNAFLVQKIVMPKKFIAARDLKDSLPSLPLKTTKGKNKFS